jgi:hypothetical protein
MVRYLRYVGSGFRLAHTIWALLAASLCILLVVGGGGHPPPIIFLPVVLVIWCSGHVALWGIRRLEARGRELTAKTTVERESWPPGLIIALIGTGLVACVGLVQLGGTLLLGNWYPFAGTLWAVAMAVCMAHGACFVGLLLRRPWSRPATAVLSIGWALLPAWQISEQLVHGYRINLAEYVTLFVGIALMSFLGYHILSSPRIRAFFGSE